VSSVCTPFIYVGPIKLRAQRIPYAKQSVNWTDFLAVARALGSEFLTQGPLPEKFEKEVAAYVNAKYAVSANSATSALHTACLSLGVGPGDIVWTSAITFVASANCAIYCGATVDFIDIDPETYNMSVESLTRKLKAASASGQLPKVVIPVHLTGQPCEMKEIYKLSLEYGFRIIEDASHAIGARYRNGMVGSCEFSDITVFSFHPVKIITTGEGGMATTNDLRLANKLKSLRSHGITRKENEMLRLPDGPWYYEQIELGYNYRMTDLQAALGLSQLRRIERFLRRRREIAKLYLAELSKLAVTTPLQSSNSQSAFHLYVLQIRAKDRLNIFNKLRDAGVLVNLHYIPVYRHPFYSNLGFNQRSFPNSENYYAQALSLPMFPKLRNRQVKRICKILAELVPAK
jgi:UDP-4-amino-4,6-dideoxy-N-acetyl-beta-L-altrosamine transaminase